MKRHSLQTNATSATLVAALGALLLATPGEAQQAFPSGGGHVASTNFSADVSIGGTFLGNATSTNFSTSTGFLATLPANGPFGVLPPATAVAGTDATITALLQDDVQVVSANLLYRRGGALNFTTLPMTLTNEGTGEWSVNVPGVDLAAEGVQYFVEATDGVNTSSIPPTAPAGLTNLPVRVANHPAFSLPAGTYELAGAPLVVDDPDPAAVFDELGGFNPAVWRYGTFDPVSGTYDEAQNGADATSGQGFWVIAASATNVAVTGTTTDLSQNATITLQPGFNQIANPFAFAVNFGNVTLPTDVDANLIGWDGTQYVNGVQVFAPATGYWLFHGGTTAVDLEIPPVGTSSSARGVPTVEPGLVPADEEDAWSVVVTATAGDVSDGGNRFGVRADATAAKDAYDFADAPAPPAGYAVASFADEDGFRLLSDYRPHDEAGVRWTLRFDSDQIGETYRLAFDVERELPAEWSLWAWPAGRRDAAIDVSATGELTGRITEASTSLRWILAAGRPDFLDDLDDDVQGGVFAPAIQDFAFSAAFPNPARAASGTNFEFRVPQPTRVSVQLFDVRGRQVTTLLDGSLDAGVHSLRWNGRDRTGRVVGSGVYFVRVQAEGFSHRGKVLILD